MAEAYTLSERHLPEELREQAVASDSDAMELFRERVQGVSEWTESVSDGNEEQAIVYAVNEIWRTTDNVGESQTVTDSIGSDLDQVDEGRFDLRQHTKND